MTDEQHTALQNDGWTVMDDDGFIALIGPLWWRDEEDGRAYAMLAQDKHRNRRGVVQGGVLMTLADRTCGMAARAASGAASLATVRLDSHFADAARLGEVMISRPKALRAGKSLIFMATQIVSGGRTALTASAVFKVVRLSGMPGAPD